ncbi:MAG: GNAT family N-acetyltransferase [Alphaproteobacteria bacterium]|nr:GNAT family N-acetyltransferase [Alphaproteobacteria bacterium]
MISTPPALLKDYHKTACFYFESIAIECLQERNIEAFVTGILNTAFNVVITTDININDIPTYIEKVKRFFERYNVPWRWVIDNRAASPRLEECLEQNGLKYKDTFSSMFLDLEVFEAESWVKKFDIRKVSDLKELKDWSLPIKEGFVYTEESSAMFVKLNAVYLSCDLGRMQHYVVYHDNQPVASATLSLSEDGVRLNNVATCIKFQRQGFASGVIAYALDKAKRAGHKYCFLDSSAKGVGVYSRLGFKQLSTYKNYEFLFNHKKVDIAC